jgi:hypothetical protein
MDVTFQTQLTLLKLEWQNARYEIKIEEGSKSKSVKQFFFFTSGICEFRHVDNKIGFNNLAQSCRTMLYLFKERNHT